MASAVKEMMDNIKEILESEKKFTSLCKKAFDEIDTDCSGNISRAELRIAVKYLAIEASIEVPSDELFESAFDMLDTDKNGEISYCEFSAGVRLLLNAMVKK